MVGFVIEGQISRAWDLRVRVCDSGLQLMGSRGSRLGLKASGFCAYKVYGLSFRI